MKLLHLSRKPCPLLVSGAYWAFSASALPSFRLDTKRAHISLSGIAGFLRRFATSPVNSSRRINAEAASHREAENTPILVCKKLESGPIVQRKSFGDRDAKWRRDHYFYFPGLFFAEKGKG